MTTTNSKANASNIVNVFDLSFFTKSVNTVHCQWGFVLCSDGLPLDRNISGISVSLRSSEQPFQPTPVYWDGDYANGAVKPFLTFCDIRPISTIDPWRAG